MQNWSTRQLLFYKNIFGKKVNKTRVFPITLKIVFIFSLFILLSNFASNYINLIFNRYELLKLMDQLLTKDLKDIYSYSNNEFEIYQYDKNIRKSLESIERKGLHDLKNKKAIILGINEKANIVFQAARIKRHTLFADRTALDKMTQNLKSGKDEDKINFHYNNQEYFGMYKYNPRWNLFIVRAEEVNEFYSESRYIFMFISTIIVIITVIMAIVGIQYIRYFLRFIYIMTKSIMKMINAQKLETINLKGATNDDVTYLGVAFNSLSSVVANLMGIFQKFANQDIVLKAYRESQVKLEGTKKDLTIFFSDIKGFTYITEALGNDIIKLLNLHYDRAIREIITLNGVMGSIIGDALLAVFGALEDSTENKSLQAVRAAYKIHEITGMLRNRMTEIKEQVEHEKGKLSNEELKIYKAVLLEVGVGIDGGEVFYGTLGSYVRMTNTVIGDNVNAASRLEGLTRIYHVPTIVSEYVKKDIENNTKDHGLHFVELDTVMVKGKTKGQKIFWPVREIDFNKMLKSELPACELGLESYYKGEWGKAHKKFARCKLPFAEVFKKRTSENCPKNWSGIWELKTK